MSLCVCMCTCMCTSLYVCSVCVCSCVCVQDVLLQPDVFSFLGYVLSKYPSLKILLIVELQEEYYSEDL